MSKGPAYTAALHFLAGDLPGSESPRLLRWKGRYYIFNGICYSPAADDEIEAHVTRFLARTPGVRFDGKKDVPITRALVQDCLLGVRSEAQSDLTPGDWRGGPPPGSVGPFLPTPGGLVDLGQAGDPAAALIPNSPDYFGMAALPVTPNWSQGCPIWDRFLRTSFDRRTDLVGYLQEVFGYTLCPDCRFELFFFLYGPPCTGKSTAVDTLRAMLGESNVSGLTLERLGGRFDLAMLIGKRANIVYDASEIDRTAEGTLKSLASGEHHPVEEKYHQTVTMPLPAKHIFATNTLPRFHDTSGGIFRRIGMVPFERPVPAEERDVGLKAALRVELPAILAWSIDGLRRLFTRGRFEAPAYVESLVLEYRRDSNPVAIFTRDECEAAPDARVGRQALFAAYKAWASHNGHQPLSSTRFYREVRNLYPQPEAAFRDGRGGDRVFVGLRLRAAQSVVEQFRDLITVDKAGMPAGRM